MPVDIASIEPASTACRMLVVAASSLISANPKGWSTGCCSDGLATQLHDSTVPAGPTSTKSWASSSPVAGSHSIGGQMTRSPQRMPMIRCSVRAVMNAPTTGPRDRLYGNWMVISRTSLTVLLLPGLRGLVDQGK